MKFIRSLSALGSALGRCRRLVAALGGLADAGRWGVGGSTWRGWHGLPSLWRFARMRLVLGFEAGGPLARLGENPPGEPWLASGQPLAAARVERELSRADVVQVRCEPGIYGRWSAG